LLAFERNAAAIFSSKLPSDAALAKQQMIWQALDSMWIIAVLRLYHIALVPLLHNLLLAVFRGRSLQPSFITGASTRVNYSSG